MDLPHFVPVGLQFDPACIGFDFYSDCIQVVQQGAGLGRLVVVGHSHHGNVALEHARRRPNDVSRVVLIGTPPANIATTLNSAERYWQRHASTERKSVLQNRRTLAAVVSEGSQPPCQAYIRQYVTDAPLYWHDLHYDAAWLWHDMSFSMDAVHAFRKLYASYDMRCDTTTPVLVVMGVNDFAVPPTMWNALLPNLGNVTFRQLERSGRTPQLEQADEFDGTLLAWLTGFAPATQPG